MSAYLIVLLKMEHPSWVEDYIANVPAIIASFGGDYLAVSKSLCQFEGSLEVPDQIALFTFPSMAQMTGFMTSDAYAPYKKARIAGSSSEIFGLEN